MTLWPVAVPAASGLNEAAVQDLIDDSVEPVEAAIAALPAFPPPYWVGQVCTRPGSTVLLGNGLANANAVAGASQAVEAEGHFVNIATSTTDNNEVGWSDTSAGYDSTQRRHSPVFYCKMKTAASVADISLCVSLCSQAFPRQHTVHAVAFTYDTDIDGTAFWRCYTAGNDGAADTGTTTVAVTADTVYEFLIDMSDADEVVYSINGVVVHTATAHLPGLTQNLGYSIRVATRTTAAKSFKFGRLAIKQDW